MSTRQNNKKQRKGRNNANNRERTVTTLTEDPNTPYLIPTPSEEPAGSLMSAFSGQPAGGKMHNMPMGPPAYQLSGNFGGFPYNSSFPTMHPNMQQQPYFSPSVNQPHVQQQQQAPPQKLQPAPNSFKLPPGKNDLEILQKLKKTILDNQHPFYRAEPSPSYLASLYKGPPAQDAPASSSFAQSGGHTGKMSGRKERRNTGGGIQQSNGNQGNRYNASSSNNLVSGLDLQSLKISKNLTAPPPSGSDPRSSDPSAPSTDYSAGSNVNQEVPDAQRQGRYEYPSRRIQKTDSTVATGDRPAHDMDVDVPAYGGKDDLSRPGGWAPRDSVPSDARAFERERATTPRPPNPGGPTSVDTRPPGGANRGAGPPGDGSDREAPRRGEWQPDRDRHVSHDQRMTDARKSSAASEQGPTEPGYNQHPAHRGGPNDPPIPGLSDSRPTDVRGSNVVSDTPPSARDLADTRPPGDSQPPETRNDSHAAPPRSAERVGHDANGEDVQSSRASSLRPADSIPAPLGPSSFPPATPATGDIESSDDPSQRPSLKDRMSQQPPSRQASGDGHPHPPNSDRPHKRKFQKGHYGGPPKGGFGRSAPHDGPPPQSGGPRAAFRPRSPPPSKLPPSPSRGPPRDFRPRDLSRDRGPGGGYRPDVYDPRRPEIVDPDVPMTGRYDGRPGYDDFSAPPPMSGGRGPPPGADAPGRGEYYRQYPPGRRGEWDADNDDYYKSRGWAPPDRERYERDYPPRSAGWDGMADREYHPRDYPPVDDRYVPGPPGDRGGRPPPAGYPPYGRVRPRSPSPLRRSGSGPIDDARPPLKRPREDFPPGDYYPGGGRRPSEYPPPPPRSGSPGAPPNSGWAPPPPPPGSSAAPGPPGDRDYYPPPGGYDRGRSPPGPSGGRMPYNRGPGGYGRGGGGEPRDRPGYGMPAPRG